MKRKNLIILGLTSIVVIVILIISFAYGFINNNIKGNTNENSVVVDLENSSIEFTDLSTNDIDVLIEPGFVDIKLFTVKNLGNVSATYNIYLTDVVNDFVRLSDLKYYLYRKEGNNTINTSDLTDCTLVSSGTYPKINSYLVLGEELEHANDIYTYALKVEYINSEENQDANKGKVFGGKIQINASSDNLPNTDTLTYKILDNAIKGDNGTTFKTVPDTTPAEEISTENEKEISIALDDLGTSYYFRGNVTNNWVKFGKEKVYRGTNNRDYPTLEYCQSKTTNCNLVERDILWRIIRINGDGSVRMIYTGTTDYHTNNNMLILPTTNSRLTSYNNVITSIGNYTLLDSTYLGYMYSSDQEFMTSRQNYFVRISVNTQYKFYKLESFNEGSNCTTTEENGNTIRTCYNYNSQDVLESTCTRITDSDNNTTGYCTLINNNNYIETTWKDKFMTTDPSNEYKYTCWQEGNNFGIVDNNGNTSCMVVSQIAAPIPCDGCTSTDNKQPNQAYVYYKGYYSGIENTSNRTSSTIKTEVDAWYQKNFYNTTYENYIEDEIFCNDRANYAILEDGTQFRINNSVGNLNDDVVSNYYGYEIRSYINSTTKTSRLLSLKCTRDIDTFTVSDSIGNGDLTYPVGLITADEGKYAGHNSNSYLKGTYFWTMSPMANYSTAFNSWGIGIANGSVVGGYQITANNFGIRPVINLKANSIYSSGDGTVNNPYEIVIEE